MDPEKAANAPLSEKSTMGPNPPPPYHDNPLPWQPQPGQGYPPQPQPGPGYPQQPQYGGPGYGGPGYGGPGYGPQSYQPYPPQQDTVIVQPTQYVVRGPLENPVNDYLCYSIFTMLCCCLPLGIAALIYSISAREANHVGDRMGAERSSRTARTLNHVALGLGIGVLVLSIVYVVVMSSLIHN